MQDNDIIFRLSRKYQADLNFAAQIVEYNQDRFNSYMTFRITASLTCLMYVAFKVYQTLRKKGRYLRKFLLNHKIYKILYVSYLFIVIMYNQFAPFSFGLISAIAELFYS